MPRASGGESMYSKREGVLFAVLQTSCPARDLRTMKDLAQIAQIWQKGSVVRSWLLDLTLRAFEEDPGLESLQAYVEDSGEGRWAIQESIDLSIPAPVITLALQARFYSRQQEPFGAKLLAALRQQFGGHAVKKTRVDDA